MAIQFVLNSEINGVDLEAAITGSEDLIARMQVALAQQEFELFNELTTQLNNLKNRYVFSASFLITYFFPFPILNLILHLLFVFIYFSLIFP